MTYWSFEIAFKDVLDIEKQIEQNDGFFLFFLMSFLLAETSEVMHLYLLCFVFLWCFWFALWLDIQRRCQCDRFRTQNRAVGYNSQDWSSLGLLLVWSGRLSVHSRLHGWILVAGLPLSTILSRTRGIFDNWRSEWSSSSGIWWDSSNWSDCYLSRLGLSCFTQKSEKRLGRFQSNPSL